MKPKILVTRIISEGAEDKLKKEFDVDLNLKDEPIPTGELIKMGNDCDGLITSGFDKVGEVHQSNLLLNLGRHLKLN